MRRLTTSRILTTTTAEPSDDRPQIPDPDGETGLAQVVGGDLEDDGLKDHDGADVDDDGPHSDGEQGSEPEVGEDPGDDGLGDHGDVDQGSDQGSGQDNKRRRTNSE